MDESRDKLRQLINMSAVSEELKAKQLLIVNDEELSIPEVKLALAELIAAEVDAILTERGIADEVTDPEVAAALADFEQASTEAETDLAADMQLVDECLADIKEVSEEIQKAALQQSLS